MSVQEKLYSADDLWALSRHPEYRERRLELSEGVLIDMAPASGSHGLFTFRFGIRLGVFAETNGLGCFTAAETGFILYKNPTGRDTVRAPDIGYVRRERCADIPATGYVPFAPDLAVEVASPDESGEDIQDKVLDYLRYGTSVVWYFYPKSRTVNVHTPSGTTTLGEDDTLDGGDVLPGFNMKVSEIFG
jgi:Uma2 family endonuclease